MKWGHTHHCNEDGCKARVLCVTPPVQYANNRAECPDKEEEFLCEDHKSMTPCDWCGRREGGPLIEVSFPNYTDHMHPECVAEYDASEKEFPR